MDTPILELLRKKPWTTLEDAELGPVLLYFRGLSSLKMPVEYRDICPSSVDVAPSLQRRQIDLLRAP